MNRLLLPLTVLAAGLSGCIIYEETLVRDDDGRHVPDRPDDADDADESFALWLNPAGAVAGETVIVSLLGEGDVDLRDVAEITFFGESSLEVVATSKRDDHELLLTLSSPPGATLGDNDLLVEFEGGKATFLRTAFRVVSSEADIPDSPGPGETEDDGNTGDGSSGDGSSGGGGSSDPCE